MLEQVLASAPLLSAESVASGLDLVEGLLRGVGLDSSVVVGSRTQVQDTS